MAAIFYLGTIIFFVYVIYTVTFGYKQAVDSGQGQTAARPKAASRATIPESGKSTSATPETAILVRNPETGETAAIPSNYRFAKRWIKETMVSEGLLDKVYSNIELDEEASAKVKIALEQFRALDEYQT